MQKCIVFYDEECGLCQTSVQLILKYQTTMHISFASLQQIRTIFQTDPSLIETNKQIHSLIEYAQTMNTLVVYTNKRLYTKTLAIAHIIKVIQRWTFILFPFVYVSHYLGGKFVYQFVAKYRHRLFQRRCLLMKKEWQSLFLKTEQLIKIFDEE